MNALGQELRIVPGKTQIMANLGSYAKSTSEAEAKLYKQIRCLKAILGCSF